MINNIAAVGFGIFAIWAFIAACATLNNDKKDNDV